MNITYRRCGVLRIWCHLCHNLLTYSNHGSVIKVRNSHHSDQQRKKEHPDGIDPPYHCLRMSLKKLQQIIFLMVIEKLTDRSHHNELTVEN